MLSKRVIDFSLLFTPASAQRAIAMFIPFWVATQRSCRRRHAFKNRVACSTKSSGYWWCAP